MKLKLVMSCVAVVLLGNGLAQGQELPAFAEPVKEHEWLKQFAGEWETESKGSMGEGQPELSCTGTMKGRMIGGFWIHCEYQMNMMGMQMTALQTVGYNAEKKAFVGTWVDSAMNHMWQYEGNVDRSGKVLTLQAEGPDMLTGQGTAQYQDIYEFKSADEFTITSKMQVDGNWVTFMAGTARRVKTVGK